MSNSVSGCRGPPQNDKATARRVIAGEKMCAGARNGTVWSGEYDVRSDVLAVLLVGARDVGTVAIGLRWRPGDVTCGAVTIGESHV